MNNNNPIKKRARKKYRLYETNYYIANDGCITKTSKESYPYKYTQIGTTRKRKTSAQLAAKRTKRIMLLSALAAELNGEKNL